MRRLIVALCLLASPAEAGKVLIFTERIQAVGIPTAQNAYNQMDQRSLLMVTDVFDRTGVSYRIVNPAAAKTEFARTGQMVWNFGTAAATAEQFDACIIVGWRGRATALAGYTTLRGDSLTLTSKAPTVPLLCIIGAAQTDFVVALDPSTSCSTGVNVNAGDASAKPRTLRAPGSARPFLSGAHQPIHVLRPGTYSGGIRPLLYSTTTNLETRAYANNLNSPWADSTTFADTNTFVTVWEKLNSHKAGTSRVVFANVLGIASCFDSVANDQPCEGDGFVLMVALAHLDSLTGGAIFADKSKLPLKAGVAIFGGFSRSTRRNAGGISPSDTTTLDGTCDSLAQLNVPITLGVNVDSIASFPADKRWWVKLPKIRYAPLAMNGIADSTKAGGNASYTYPIDIWGRFRSRPLFYGPADATDSSVFGLYKGACRIVDSTFGSNRRSRVVLAPDDDWSPLNIKGKSRGPDSLLFVMQRAGIVGVLTDVQRPEGDPSRIKASRDLVRGWYGRQGLYLNNLLGVPVKVIGHAGYATIGGGGVVDARLDSIVPITLTGGSGGPSTQPIPSYEVNRFVNGFLFPKSRDVDYMQVDGQSLDQGDNYKPRMDSFEDMRRASVFKCHVNDLAGAPENPMRSGYWVIKSIANAFDTINRYAGRSLCIISNLEDVTP